ncbi:hypothetical protein FA95DRAFT_1611633 [Auriscalpium vulgare]|uniref:Uncharacterized protein n=1 Tax=Auriscalpium vulgare TaxID=40419 RepID=A0ACB8R990_9AGAM|nr:hypothetical protein FA95DRAFT_1611633 [Auriscalpium vulgare]
MPLSLPIIISRNTSNAATPSAQYCAIAPLSTPSMAESNGARRYERSTTADHSDPSSYWSSSSATRIARLNHTPELHVSHDLSTLPAIQERVESLQRAKVAISQQALEETQALVDALGAIQRYFKGRQAAVEDTLRVALERHNTLIPISRIPPEVLERIFCWTKDLYPLSGLALLTESRLAVRVRATMHVCRSWRHITLACPRFWDTVDLPMEVGIPVDVVFSRSNLLPLRVTATLEEGRTDDKLICDNLSRTRHLRVFLGPGTGLSLWTAPRLSTLVSLNVVYLSYRHWSGNIPTMREVIEALRRMTSLEEFTLRIPSMDHYPEDEDLVLLPGLSYLYLTSTIDSTQCLLKRLRLPSTGVFRVQLIPHFPDDDDDTDPTALFAALRPALHASNIHSDAAITKLVISAAKPWSATITSRTAICVSAWRGTHRSYVPSLSLEFPRGSQEWGDGWISRNAAYVFSSEHLQELSMLDVKWDEATWRTILSLAPSVQLIEAAGGGAAPLCRVLGSPGSQNSHMLVPQLVTLKLRDISFEGRYAGPNQNANGFPLFGHVLKYSLVARACAGHGIKKLDLRSCGPINRQYFEGLRGFTLFDVNIVAPCDPHHSSLRTVQWVPFVESDRGGTLRICARQAAHSGSEIIVLEELELDSNENIPDDYVIFNELDNKTGRGRPVYDYDY